MTENNHVEYKRQLTDALEKEVIAFLNAGEGGTLYIGLDKNGKAFGVADCDQTQLVIKDRLKNNIQPSIMGLFDILHETRDGKDVLRIVIAGGLEKPYFLKKYGMTEKGCYLRVGSSCDPMPKEMIETLYGKRVRNTIGRMESPRRDLTFAQLKIYYETRGLHLNESFLKNLELLTPEDHPNYAAYLLADDNGSSLQVAKYAGLDRVNLIENRDYGRCSLVKALKSLLDRVNVENTIFTKIGYPLRQEREMIDTIAIREAIINAVVHNDYSYGAVPKLEFFADRAEVTSMGGLPYGVTETDFFGGCSIPRNKEIMRVFRDLEIVEQLGSGVPRILKAYGKEAFEIRDSFIRIIFKFEQSMLDTGGVERLVEGLAENQQTMLRLIKKHPSISKREMAERIGVSSTSIDKSIITLKNAGILQRVGSARKGHWALCLTPQDHNPDARQVRVETRVEMRVETSEQILKTLQNNPQLSLNEVATAIGKATSTVERAASKLIKNGQLKHVGPKKGGHWQVIQEETP